MTSLIGDTLVECTLCWQGDGGRHPHAAYVAALMRERKEWRHRFLGKGLFCHTCGEPRDSGVHVRGQPTEATSDERDKEFRRLQSEVEVLRRAKSLLIKQHVELDLENERLAAHVADLQHHGYSGRGGLFQSGDVTFHSGAVSDWKIECDALTQRDVATLARLIAERVGSFGLVEGVPRGGVRLAMYLEQYADPMNPRAPLLIVDDVCTTGASLEQHRAGRPAIGYVLFVRGQLPLWCRALFTLDSQRHVAQTNG